MCGTIRPGGGRVLTISRREAKLALTMSLGSRSMEVGSIAPESENRFFNADDPRCTDVFVTDAQGRM
jgi:hypothetical protein